MSINRVSTCVVRVIVFSSLLSRCFQEVLEQLHEVLGSLRNRLKYAARLRSIRVEFADALAAVGSRDEQIEHHVQDKAKLRREADAAVKDSIRLAKRNQQWYVTHVRLKDPGCY